MAGRLGKFVEAMDMEKVLPIATKKEKRMRFAWEALLSKEFLMNWALVNEPPEKIGERLSRWLEMVEQGKFRRSGQPGRHL